MKVLVYEKFLDFFKKNSSEDSEQQKPEEKKIVTQPEKKLNEVKMFKYKDFADMLLSENLYKNKIARRLLQNIKTDTKINFVDIVGDEEPDMISYFPLDKLKDVVLYFIEPRVGDEVILKVNKQDKLPDYAYNYLIQHKKYTIKEFLLTDKGKYKIDIGYVSEKTGEVFYFAYSRFLNISDHSDEITTEYIKEKLTKEDIIKIKESPLRKKMSIGKFATAIFGNEFTPVEYEEFVNLYKNEILDLFKDLVLVSGDDIPKYYNKKRYAVSPNDTSSNLAGSCMGNEEADVFEIYANNPKKINLLILKDKHNPKKIAGRALVWQLDEPNNSTFMDTVYVRDQNGFDLFKKYAEKNKWLYKSKQRYADDGIVINGMVKKIVLGTQLKPKKYDQYPFVDTLYYYNTETGLISNSHRYSKANLQLRRDNGNYDVIG